MSRVCCITGMHRSGTSLVTAWLHRCGLPVDAGRRLAASPGNPRGFFEDLDFVELHQSIILTHNPRSAGWRLAATDFLPLPGDARELARRLVERRNTLHPVWGWKDPRSVLFLPAWKNLIPDLKVIVIWRPCLGVVLSLLRRWLRARRRRVFITPGQAIRLWRTHNERALAYRERFPRDTVLVPLARLTADDRFWFDRIRLQLDLPLTHQPLAGVYEPKLLHRAGGRTSGLFGIRGLERRLALASAAIDPPRP